MFVLQLQKKFQTLCTSCEHTAQCVCVCDLQASQTTMDSDKSTAQFEIPSLKALDGGLWECRVSTNGGQDSRKFNLIVRGQNAHSVCLWVCVWVKMCTNMFTKHINIWHRVNNTSHAIR